MSLDTDNAEAYKGIANELNAARNDLDDAILKLADTRERFDAATELAVQLGMPVNGNLAQDAVGLGPLADATLSTTTDVLSTTDFDGPDAPIAFRNRNPGNIRPTAHGAKRWRGEIDTDNAYARFSTNLYGTRALLYLISISYPRAGIDTIRQFVLRFSPHGDNEVASVNGYINFLERNLEINADSTVDFNERDIAFRMALWVARFESGRADHALGGLQGQQLMREAWSLLPGNVGIA